MVGGAGRVAQVCAPVRPCQPARLALIAGQLTDRAIKALWLETITNSLKDMMHNNLNINAKHEFAGIFSPPKSALPPPDFGPLLGLQFETSILHRQVKDLFSPLAIVSVHGAGGQSHQSRDQV